MRWPFGLKTMTASSEPWERAETLRAKEVAMVVIPRIHVAPKEILYVRGF
jgi:hypothetical protein